MKNILLSVIIVFLSSINVFSQVTISGVVRDKTTKDKVPAVNVLLKTKDGKSIHSYTTTKDDGTYQLRYSGSADSIMINVVGFNIKAQKITVARKNQSVNFLIEEEVLQIREVIVKAEPITRRSDTLNYYVARFIDSLDRTIGDVLKKMPGIDVEKSGEIKYNGRAINKFYVEGMDMLKGRYGLATNNIAAKDIATVQVLENHQPIKALKHLQISDDVAINLKLKGKAKGTFNSTVLLGGGYKPAMWTGELTAMYFARKFQTFNTYKTNNVGDDVSRELKSFYGGMDGFASILGILTPSTPPIDKQRYLNNNVHSVSANVLRKLNDNYEISVNSKYVHDLQTSKASSITTYYLPETSSLVIVEQSEASKRLNDAEIGVELKANTEKIYLKENLSFGGAWNKDYGQIINTSDTVNQNYDLSGIRFKNEFSFIKPFKNLSVYFSSISDYNSTPSTLTIAPFLYPEIFGIDNNSFKNASQYLENKQFRTSNFINIFKPINSWIFSCSASFNADIHKMSSVLNPSDNTGTLYPSADSLQNDINWRKVDAILSPGISYVKTNSFEISLNIPIDFMSLNVDDKIIGNTNQMNKVVIRPYARIVKYISNNIKFYANASLSNNFGGLYDTYSGYIMSNYRMILNRSGNISESQYQNYSANLSYGNAILSLFGSIEGTYWKNKSNTMYGTQYTGTLSKIESFNIDNISQGYRLNGKISKRFDGIATTITLTGGFNRSYRDVLRQGTVMNTEYTILNTGIDLGTRLGEAFRFNYIADYSLSNSKISNNNLLSINIFSQKTDLNFIIAKKLTFKIAGEHYYNGSVSGNNRSMLFLDASANYKTKKFEYTLEARNLFNTKNFNSAFYNEVTSYIFNYQLRPLSVIFKIKFSIR
ncbi:MAG: carboxypeptidase-like regulatory domain-containing protein [Bacteroidales bacterium]